MRRALPSVWLVVPLVVMAVAFAGVVEGQQRRPRAPRGGPPAAAHPATPPPSSAELQAAKVQRGAMLVTFGSCDDCHTPWSPNPNTGMPVPDFNRRLSGHPEGAPNPRGMIGPGDMALIGPTFTSFNQPIGMVYSSNLTPCPETGIGRWSEDDFVTAIRAGRHHSGRPILPPMPWPNLASLPEEDLRAIHAFLLSLPPITNRVPDPWVSKETLEKFRAAPPHTGRSGE